MRTDGRVGADTPTRRRILLAVGTGVVSGLAGCGDGGTGSGTPTPNDDVDDAFDEDDNENSTSGNETNDDEEPTPGPAARGPIDIPALERAIGTQANDIRAANGQGLLDWDPELQSIARDHSEEMIRQEYFDSVGPMGQDWGDRYQAANYDCAIQVEGGYLDGGENIARITYEEAPGREQIAIDIVEQWRTGDDARSDLLATYWNVHGIGVALDPQAAGTRIYVTQNFC